MKKSIERLIKIYGNAINKSPIETLTNYGLQSNAEIEKARIECFEGFVKDLKELLVEIKKPSRFKQNYVGELIGYKTKGASKIHKGIIADFSEDTIAIKDYKTNSVFVYKYEIIELHDWHISS